MDYRNPAECLELLKRLNPVNANESHLSLTTMLDALLEAQPPANQHLEVLESARSLADLIQEQMARRYADHPLPPESGENETLLRVVSLWQLFARSYAEITRRDAAAGTLDDQRALLAQRRVYYAGFPLIEYYRAHRTPPLGAWADLHESFMMSEAQGIAGIRVPDPLNEVWHAQSPTEAFVTTLLVDLANPFGRSPREFKWVCRWAQRFAPYCSLIGTSDTDPSAKPTAYAIDLAGDGGLKPISVLNEHSKSLRRFDGSKLAGQIQAVFKQFKQGVQPAALGLGEDCPIDASSKLLVSLYRPWGLASVGRRFPRRGGRGHFELTGDWLAIGFHIQGKRFEQPGGPSVTRSLRSDLNLLTFGERVEEVKRDFFQSHEQRQREAERLGFVCESWEMLDQSVGGFRVARRARGERIEHHQLIGLRPPDGECFLLGQVTWLMYRTDGVLEGGINMLNGIPKVVAVRLTGVQPGQRGAYQQAFWLPDTPSLKKPSSIILPAGWFKPQRVLDVYDGRTRQYRLMELLQRGSNFDQVSYEILPKTA